jgi:hypothetical protein
LPKKRVDLKSGLPVGSVMRFLWVGWIGVHDLISEGFSPDRMGPMDAFGHVFRPVIEFQGRSNRRFLRASDHGISPIFPVSYVKVSF